MDIAQFQKVISQNLGPLRLRCGSSTINTTSFCSTCCRQHYSGKLSARLPIVCRTHCSENTRSRQPEITLSSTTRTSPLPYRIALYLASRRSHSLQSFHASNKPVAKLSRTSGDLIILDDLIDSQLACSRILV